MKADSLQNSPYFCAGQEHQSGRLKVLERWKNKVKDCVRPSHFAGISHGRALTKKPTINFAV